MAVTVHECMKPCFNFICLKAKDPDLDNSSAHFKWILVVDREIAPDFKARQSLLRKTEIGTVTLLCLLRFGMPAHDLEAMHAYMPVMTPKATDRGDKTCAGSPGAGTETCESRAMRVSWQPRR